MGHRVEEFVAGLAVGNRLLLLGGLAVIRHGLSRYTKDADVWMVPLENSQVWTGRLLEVVERFPGTAVMQIFPPKGIASTEIPGIIERDGVVRVSGLEKPLDVFREPNELEHLSFDDVWARSVPFEGNLRLMSEIDLLLTKQNTGREQDRMDVLFLEGVVREKFAPELASCSPARAREIFAEYLDHVVLEAALANPSSEVQELAWLHLQQFAEEGDPFAREIRDRRLGSR